ncbi:GNAT family N-acetyltransferase [Chloroflexota bacterium]
MIIGNNVRLRTKILGDAANDYCWQTDPEITQLDAALPLTINYRQYLSEYFNELHYPISARCTFAIETLDGKHIGNCMYYAISETKNETEMGIMIGDRCFWNKGYGTEAISILVSYVFQRTNLGRIYLKTLYINRRAQRCFEKSGFTSYGQKAQGGYEFVLMEIKREQWWKQQMQV